MPEATLKAKLTGDSAEFKRSLREGIDAAKEFSDKVGDSIRETVMEVAALTIGVESLKEGFEKVYEGVKGVFDLSRDLRNLHNQTGISIGDLVQLRAEFDLSGIAADEVGSVINRMQRAIENASDKGGEASLVFARLGLNIYELQQLNPAQQFDILRQRLDAIQDPARRAQEAMKLFGNMGGGGSLLAVFGNDKIASEAANIIQQQADILARNADTFQDVSIGMEAAGMRMEGFFIGMAEPISRVLLPVLRAVESTDLSKWGEKIGTGVADAVRILYNAFEDGKLTELARLSLKVAFEDAGNWLIGVVPVFGQAIADVFGSDFAAHLSNIFDGVAMQFGASLLNAFASPILAMQGAIAYGSRNVGVDSQLSSLRKQIAQTSGEENMYLGRQNYWAARGNGASADKNGGIADKLQSAVDDMRKQYQDLDSGRNLAFGDYVSQYIKENQATMFGSSSSDMSAAGGAMIKSGTDGLGGAFTALTDKLKDDIASMKPASVLGDDSQKLADLIKSLQKSIPGEGKENAPDQPDKRSSAGDFFGAASLEGIHKGENGAWSFFSSSGQGGVNFNGDGMSGRAGRVMASPDGSDPAQQLSTALGYLKSISSTLNAVAAPA